MTAHRTLPLLAAGALSLCLALPSAAAADDGAEQRQDRDARKAERAGDKPTRERDADPRGNNGTVKVDGVPLDDGRGNEPHVGCAFALRFYGFDAGDTATISFRGQAPTRTGTLLTQRGVTISDDAAGGGQDRDAVLTYTAEQLGLTDVPPAKQGWHVKVAVDVDSAPGGAKQKVFWLSCPQEPAGGTGTSGTPTGGTPTGGTPTGGTPTGGTPTSGTPTGGTATGGSVTGGSGSAGGFTGGSGSVGGFTGGSGTVAQGGPGLQVPSPAAGGGAGAGAAVPTVAQSRTELPFTGAPLALALALGLGTTAAGALAARAGRRRSDASGQPAV